MTGPRAFRGLRANARGNAAVELAMIAPMVIILMFGSAELGNYFLDQHAVTKQVRDGARYASRLSLATAYDCTAGAAADSGVYADADAETNIINVTKTGSVDGSATGRFGDDFWTACDDDADALSVTMRCVDKTGYSGIYSGLAGDIPVVTVHANVAYPSLFNAVGFDAGGLCLHAESEAAVTGL